jgi:preprotein translocase subunit SecA
MNDLQEGFMRELERFIVLQVVDTRWREHLENMDYMREGIGLRGLAQKDPLVEYRNEGAVMFAELNRAVSTSGSVTHRIAGRSARVSGSSRIASSWSAGSGALRRRGTS